ncbi:MAG: hypothetical protein MMC33_006854 [Icmadophila ericetorum]|nr:hypothetical protein [Icmadophila ericetorum]
MLAPQSFFDKTDTGVTINRFSQDMTLVDTPLPAALIISMQAFANTLAQAALVALGSSYMGLTIPGLLITLYLSKSFIYERLNNCLLIGGMAILVVVLATTLRGTTSAGYIGVALNGILNFNINVQYLFMFWTSLETSLGAISRTRSFAERTVPETKAEESFVPDGEWPDRGEIEFRNVSASYGPEIPALRGLSLEIAPGEKIGICGRTGSGKSSLLLTLLRLLDLETGTIIVDGVDAQTVPRDLVRSSMITTPQDPFILNGSVRLNADVTETVTDELIVGALVKVGLWEAIDARGGLDVDMNNQPLSQGQQLLFCLARAMLRTGSKIVILDEPASSTDNVTNRLMYDLIRTEFRSHTMITVAHRLDTIINSDKIAVLERGQLVEFDSPEALLSRPSAFRNLKEQHL